ncbi:hypothetical protein OQE62_03835, partial [Microbulbifer halophilus]
NGNWAHLNRAEQGKNRNPEFLNRLWHEISESSCKRVGSYGFQGIFHSDPIFAGRVYTGSVKISGR